MKESVKLSFFEDHVVMPNTSGKGLKVGSFADRDFSFGWRTLYEPVTVRGTPTVNSPQTWTDPTWTVFGATGFYGYLFIVGDQIWQAYMVPHDIVPGSSVHFVQNWTNNDIASPAGAAYVTWETEYAFAKGYSQAAFDFGQATSPLTNSGTVNATALVGSAVYTHVTSTSAAVALPAMTEPGGMIYTRVRRIDNDTSPLANATEDIFLLATGLQYQSTNLATKQKSSSFYALT